MSLLGPGTLWWSCSNIVCDAMIHNYHMLQLVVPIYRLYCKSYRGIWVYTSPCWFMLEMIDCCWYIHGGWHDTGSGGSQGDVIKQHGQLQCVVKFRCVLQVYPVSCTSVCRLCSILAGSCRTSITMSTIAGPICENLPKIISKFCGDSWHFHACKITAFVSFWHFSYLENIHKE